MAKLAKKLWFWRKGFTLVEAVVVIGVFGILMLAGTDFLVQIIQNTTRTTVENEVHQNANTIMEQLGKSIRSSACVSWVVGNTAGYAPPGYGDILLNTYSDSNCLTLVDTYQFVFDPDINGKLSSGKVFKNGQQINTNGAAVVNCVGASQCASSWTNCKNGFSISGTSGTGQAVSIGLAVQATTSATMTNFCAETSLSDTITPRLRF